MKAINKHKKHKCFFLSVLSFLCFFVATTVLADVPGNDAVDPAGRKSGVIIVNERALVGPNSVAQLRGGRLFLPIATIAQALGDTLSSDPTARIVTARP